MNWVQTRQWLRSGKDAKVQTYLVGDSSGGNIVHHVEMAAVEKGIKVMENVLINPMFGGEERTESEKILVWTVFLPEGVDRYHPAANPFGPRGVSVKGINFHKSLVVASGLDLLRDRQVGYAEALCKAGKNVKLIFLEQATMGYAPVFIFNGLRLEYLNLL
ncbi:hypothetical protein MKW94_013220 [Papaver nudicaule]|uniref:Alpha/beta hydrolase fold-3 domain-containing protein n=1 Tax=Papaver nudicaule TaxID=74823 RepID=A0AA41RS49_PAPNU|nr:hypothetical protein [Papaver nudicaule]